MSYLHLILRTYKYTRESFTFRLNTVYSQANTKNNSAFQFCVWFLVWSEWSLGPIPYDNILNHADLRVKFDKRVVVIDNKDPDVVNVWIFPQETLERHSGQSSFVV